MPDHSASASDIGHNATKDHHRFQSVNGREKARENRRPLTAPPSPSQQRHPPPEHAWAPKPPPPEHSPMVAPRLERFTPGEAHFSTRNEQLAADLRAYGCHQRADGTFIESYAADLAVWLQLIALRLTPQHYLAVRLHDWSHRQQLSPPQHLAPRSAISVQFIEDFGVDQTGRIVHRWTRRPGAFVGPPAGTAWRTDKADAATAGEVSDNTVADYVERGEEPAWLYGAVYNRRELFWEQAEARAADSEDYAWQRDNHEDSEVRTRQGAGEQEKTQTAGVADVASVTGTVGIGGGEVCDRCGLPVGTCDCAARYGVSAVYLKSDDDVLRLTEADQERIQQEMGRPGAQAEDRGEHERHLQREAERARQAAQREARRTAHERNLLTRYQVCLPYDRRTARVWELGWREPYPSPGPARPPKNSPPMVLRWEHGSWTRRRVETEEAPATTQRRGRGRPQSRPRKTPYPGCVFLYARTDRSWQARLFRWLFPWGLPGAYLDGPYGWWSWMRQEAAIRQRKRALYHQRKRPSDLERPIMEQNLRAQREQELKTLLAQVHHQAQQQAHRKAQLEAYRAAGTTQPQSTSQEAARHQRHAQHSETTLTAAEHRLHLAVALACLPQNVWVSPEEVRPGETGLWLPTHQVAALWGIKSDSVSAWHRHHPEIHVDKNGVRENYYRLEDVVQRVNETAHATDRYFPWRRPA